MTSFDVSEGRRAFGADPANYDRARPAYGERVFEVLRDRCGLAPNMKTFEVGAGTGRATQRLLELGAAPLVAVEPDARLAGFMRAKLSSPDLRIVIASFEEASLGDESFDLGVAATSFHWVDEPRALEKVARLLRPGGWWVMWWQIFGDPEANDPFYRALDPILGALPASPSGGQAGRPSFALDYERRNEAIRATGAFGEVAFETFHSRHVLSSGEVRRLYSTFSDIARLPDPDRNRILDEIERIAREDFDDRVARNLTTSLYTARRA